MLNRWGGIAVAASLAALLCADPSGAARKRPPKVTARNPPPVEVVEPADIPSLLPSDLVIEPPYSSPQAPVPPYEPSRPLPTGEPLTSFLPRGALDDYVVSQFDVRTVNSSMNIGRDSYQARLMELGYRAQARKRPTDPVVMDGPNGTITLSLFERGDHNLDNIEDVLVCMIDRNSQSRVTTSQILILQKYSDTTPLVALAVGVYDARCPRLP